jgi:hypothetical protein
MQVERGEVLDIFRQSHIFQGLTDDQLEAVTDRVEAFLYDEAQEIFVQGAESDALFFVVNGRVQLSRKRKTVEDAAILETRDYFGEEALSGTPLRRRATATALSQVIVLRLPRQVLSDLRREIPGLVQPMRVILNSYLLAMDLKMEWRAPREVVHFISRRHWMFLAQKLLPALALGSVLTALLVYLAIVVYPQSSLPVIFLGIELFLLLLWFGWLVLDWSNDYAVVTNRRLVKLEKVLLLYESRQEVPLDAILADDLRTDQLGRMLGYGTILVRTFTGVMELNRLGHPQLVINLINEIRDRKKFRRHNEQLHLIDQTIMERIEHRPVQKKPPVSPEGVPVHVRPGPLQDYLSRLFALRIQEGDTITYRTHWMILLKKIAVPSLLLVLLLVLVLLIWLNLIPLGSATGTWLAIIFGPLLGLWWLYRYVDWRNDRYIITPEMISDVYRKPLGTEERKSAPIRNILSIDYERKDIIGLIFNFGTVSIRVGDTTLTFNNVANPAEVQRELFQYFMDFKKREEARLEQERHDQMADWFERYHGYIQKESPEEPDY